MIFLWPEALWLLLAVPAFIGFYVSLLRRNKRKALRYANLAAVNAAAGAGRSLRRHVPPILFVLGLVAIALAIARPQAVVTLPSRHQTVILAVDVSGSMRAADVAPNRLEAAKAAARTFAAEQPQGVRIGVVSFAGNATVVQAPTGSRDDVIAAIDRLSFQRSTAVGSGIIACLATIFPDAGVVTDDTHEKEKPLRKPVPPGSDTSAAIILLSDGQSATGPHPLDAARMSADRGIRIFTVGVGTANGEVLRSEGWSMRVRLDEERLKKIAQMTGGEYFHASTAPGLKKIYQSLNARFVLEKQHVEIGALFAAAAILMALVSALLSLAWFKRIL
ncbi:MAG: ABC transporter ATP-binding protein [Betaproteobacteria bacterium RIFCSPLOWO2_12_FULL_62_13]|nr:MAG: ABC transporter ATP-binding protein [Betaproteobacteria bacterium RIFCSPLOWO2_12_FULL_62_13]